MDTFVRYVEEYKLILARTYYKLRKNECKPTNSKNIQKIKKTMYMV
jgi:hypothetical protein